MHWTHINPLKTLNHSSFPRSVRTQEARSDQCNSQSSLGVLRISIPSLILIRLCLSKNKIPAWEITMSVSTGVTKSFKETIAQTLCYIQICRADSGPKQTPDA